MGNEVATTGGGVPALVDTPALDMGVEDIALPRLYLAQDTSKHTKRGLVKRGEFYTALGQDDDDVTILDQPVRFHVLALRRGKSAEIDGELESYAYDDQEAPSDAYTTYNYVVTLPQAEVELPHKFLLKKTGTASAKKVNLALQQAAASGPPWMTAFDLTADERHNTRGDYFVPLVSVATAKAEDVDAAAALAGFVPAEPASVPGEQANGPDQPAI